MRMIPTQTKRLYWRTFFFLLFILAPPLDLLRFDLTQNHLVLLGHPWILGIEAYQAGKLTDMELIWSVFLHIFLPIGLVVGLGIYVSWKWGRLYCGWLCPHFSVVELINALMRRASGKLSIWDRQKLPERQEDGTVCQPNPRLWPLTIVTIVLFAFLWAVVLLTYLLPPKEIYSNLLHGTLTRNQFTFIAVATVLLTIEFAFARHLFCRFGCAIGLFQSLVWMGNKKAMVVAFDRKRASECVHCDASCEHACPMRLKPRSSKLRMFTCTQCLQCVQACERVQEKRNGLTLLKPLEDRCALDASARGFGHRPEVPEGCFSNKNKGKRCCVK
jgi:polyferredoxin